MADKREIAVKRAEELKNAISDYLESRDSILTGFARQGEIREQRQKILTILGGSDTDWDDYRWHLRNRITDADLISEIIGLTDQEVEEIKEVGKSWRWAVSPYYASLIKPGDPRDPVRRQCIPSLFELEEGFGTEDPMAEEYTSPAPCITRRYPDRLIINATNSCPTYCRHCQRRRNIGQRDVARGKADLEAALDYVRKCSEIRDVLITGGDALLLSDRTLDWLLSELTAIPHVEIKRLGTRVPVTLPQRVTPELCRILEKYPPIYINTQFNHPAEITPESKEACDRLIRAGVVLGNQAVLLRGINNDPHVMKKLSHELLKIRVRPYYIFHAKPVKGTGHFVTRIEEGLEIMENLRGYTSGLAVPTYVLNVPLGLGKVPLSPQYLVVMKKDKVVLRTWENKIVEYPNKPG